MDFFSKDSIKGYVLHNLVKYEFIWTYFLSKKIIKKNTHFPIVNWAISH